MHYGQFSEIFPFDKRMKQLGIKQICSVMKNLYIRKNYLLACVKYMNIIYHFDHINRPLLEARSVPLSAMSCFFCANNA